MVDRELITTLRAELRRHGYFERRTARILLELVLHASVAIGGMWLALATTSWWLRAGGVFMSGVGSLAVGTNTHSASHNAAARRRWVNDLLTYFGYPFFVGLSAMYWWHKHVAVHHPAPNVVGIDDDSDLAPWFALTNEEAARGGRWRRFYYRRLQGFLFPVVLGVTGFRMQMFGWPHILRTIRAGGPRARKAWIDVGALTGHYLFWLGLPMLWFSPWMVLLLYAARVILIGYGMFAVLAPGHFPLDAAAVQRDHHKGDFVLLQTASTVNFDVGFVGRFLCSGLEYQIEHHLFPDISHPHYPRVARYVQEFCRKRGYPYRSYSWTRAVFESLRVLYMPKPVRYELNALRTTPAAE